MLGSESALRWGWDRYVHCHKIFPGPCFAFVVSIGVNTSGGIMKARLIAILLVLFALTPALASAQSPSVQWNRWDAQITVPASGDQMQIAETQEVNITGGTVNHGTRTWTSPVQVQNVYLIVGNDS